MFDIRKKFGTQWVAENLIPARKYQPYPKLADRQFWDGLAPELKTHLLDKGEQYKEFEWKGLPATSFLEYQRSGDRTCYEDVSFEKRMALGSLVMAECVENRGAFLDDIINGIWSICEESTWAASAHLPHSVKTKDVLPDSLEDAVLDLFALETAQLIAFSYYLLREKLDGVSKQVTKRMQGELERRVFVPYLTHYEFWWMGFLGGDINNWAPWCTCNVLWAFTLACEDDKRRAAAVNKAIETLDVFMASYGGDGACTEGPTYWYRAAGSLMDAMEIISDATGNQISLENEKLKQMGRFIYRAHIDEKYYMNFADSSVISVPEPARIFRYGKTMNDMEMMAEGAALKRLWEKPVSYVRWYSMGRAFSEMLCYNEMKEWNQTPRYEQDVWFGDAQIMIAREKAEPKEGFTLIAKGGNNGECHNHNDVGSFILFKDGQPVMIDIGVETYTKKTFSSQRYEIWTMRSSYHNVPQISGEEQRAGREFEATETDYYVGDGKSRLAMDIQKAYGVEAGVSKWNRVFELDRNLQTVHIQDTYELEGEKAIELHFMTARRPQIEGNRVVIGNAVLNIFSEIPEIEIEEIEVNDVQLKNNWGDVLYRLTLRTNGIKGDIGFEIR